MQKAYGQMDCAKDNSITKQSVKKVMEDTNCSLEIAVSWAVNANTLHGHNGYSPNVIVFGKSPSIPSVLNNKLSALKEHVSSMPDEHKLAVIKSARETFIQSESSGKIKHA